MGNGTKAGIILGAIIIVIIVFAINAYYNFQDMEYYQGKVDEAKERIAELEKQGYGDGDGNPNTIASSP